MNVHIWSECQDKDKPVWVIFVLLDLGRDMMHYEKGCMFDEQKDTRNLLDILWREYLLISDILWREYQYLLILLYMYSLIDKLCPVKTNLVQNMIQNSAALVYRSLYHAI